MEYISKDNVQNVIRTRSPNTMYTGKRPGTGNDLPRVFTFGVGENCDNILGGQRRSKK